MSIPSMYYHSSPEGFIRPARVHIIANPAGTAVRRTPILSVLNDVFKSHGIDYELLVMKEQGDARRLAREAVENGAELVAALGGDGTVGEVAEGLLGTGVPMAILPGGTANVMALTLGIPNDLTAATELLANGNVGLRAVDLGKIDGHTFLLRAAIGAEAEMTLLTEREAKSRWGNLAYVMTGLSSFVNHTSAQIYLNLDGMRVEVDGISAMIANSGNVGLAGVDIAPDIDVSDGMLDVIVIRSGDVPSLMAVATSMITTPEVPPEPLLHWKAREVHINTDPPLRVISDGEDAGMTPVITTVLPKAIQIVCPVFEPDGE